MALTKVNSAGVKDNELVNADLHTAANIDGSKLADDSVSLAKLEHGTSSNNGKFLRANNGADPSFETVDLANLSASNLTSGTIPDARFPATLPAVSAANLTNIPAANITGTLPAIDGSNLTGISSVGGSTGVDFNDDVKARFGASNDLNIYHSSSANKSIIETVAGGNLDIGTEVNADVQIKTNSVNRFNFGAGGFSALANNTYDLGTASLRWRNIYTNDLNLSNEGGANDVDGTWGDYTIQEGESDLFLINKRSGKKFKFMLQEVS